MTCRSIREFCKPKTADVRFVVCAVRVMSDDSITPRCYLLKVLQFVRGRTYISLTIISRNSVVIDT